MDDLNDLYFFFCVVTHHGFSAAARATGIEKTRLSRRIAALEQRLGVRLLQRTTRNLSLTEAGSQFYEHCRVLIEGAQNAFDSLAEMKKEPSGIIKMTCPLILAQSYLAPVLPGYMASHPKVNVIIDATDREVHIIKEGYDLALRANSKIENIEGLVARTIGVARRILVASPSYLNTFGNPIEPETLSDLPTIATKKDHLSGSVQWKLIGQDMKTHIIHIKPQLITDDLRLQLEAAIYGTGIALLPEPIAINAIEHKQLQRVLAPWSASEHQINLLYPSPKGILPSVRSLIDYLIIHLPAGLWQSSK